MSKRSDKKTPDRAWQGWLLEKLIRFFGLFSLSANQTIGRMIGRLIWWFPSGSKKTTLINLQTVFPELSEPERRQLAKHSLLHLGMMTTELGVAWCWPKQKLQPLVHVSETTQQQLAKRQSQGRGVLFLTPHIGSWEVLADYLAWNYTATFLYQPPNVASAEAFMQASRSRFGAQQAPTDIRGVRKLISALKKQEVCLVLPDQDPGAKAGIHADFFGYPARTMTLVSKLAQKADCEVVFLMAERLSKAQGYQLHAISAEAEIASEDEALATQALNAGVEACVNKLPEQYLWSYKRYRKPPQGMKSIYRR